MSRKDFQKGMIAGAKPFEEKFQKQAEAVENIGKRVEAGLDNISAMQGIILDDLSAHEKKELYDLNTMVNIAELEETERELLLAILYTLANMTDEVTKEQQNYIRSVKKYVNITEIQTVRDLSVIENIDSKKAERAILQCVMEFLFLENCNHDYWNEYEDVLDCFSVKNSEVRKIQASIDMIYRATGAEGIAEKYGYETEEIETHYIEGENSIQEAVGTIIFDMPVEDCFHMYERGVVITGRISNGVIEVGDTVEIRRDGEIIKTSVLIEIIAFRKRLSTAKAGDNVGLILRDVERNEVRHGDVVVKVTK